MANTRPGNCEKGWNDPPMFLYNPASPSLQSTAKRSPLNKRVAHNFNAQPGSTSSSTVTPPHLSSQPVAPPMAPPMTDFTKRTPTLNTTVTNTGCATNLDKPSRDTESGSKVGMERTERVSDLSAVDLLSERLETMGDEELQETCNKHLYVVVDACSTFIQKRTTDEIQRRLEIFSKMWTNGKLSKQVKVAMSKLAHALVSRQYDLAFNFHLGLMMDHVTEVTQWMVGVKRLIQEARNIPSDLELRRHGSMERGPVSEECEFGELEGECNAEGTSSSIEAVAKETDDVDGESPGDTEDCAVEGSVTE